MKLILLSILTTAILAFPTQAQPAEHESNAGYYATIQSGLAFADSDNGFALQGAIGRAYDSGLRLEVEAGLRTDGLRFRQDKGEIVRVSDVSISQYNLFANALYEFDAGYVHPYVGGGIGLAVLDVDFGRLSSVDTEFAWQLIGGASVPLTNSLSAVADYRYVHTGGLESSGLDEGAHTVSGGLRLRF